MGKIGLVAAKYIVHAHITIEGTVDRPDVIGAVFGQTEGLLGEELELRELQRNGKIGRIEVNLVTKAGKASGDIIIPSSLDKAETAIPDHLLPGTPVKNNLLGKFIYIFKSIFVCFF